LATAFAGESMARNRYTFFAEVARKEGFEQIAAIFIETAENEREHAKRFLKLMEGKGNPVAVQFNIPAVSVGTTAQNLKFSADAELEEHSQAYPRMAAVAEQEGFDEIANAFRGIATIEKSHELRFRLLLKQVEDGSVNKRKREVSWKCRNCGYIHRGTEAPGRCPVCGHERGWFEIQEVLE
jgi:rubrerythrin